MTTLLFSEPHKIKSSPKFYPDYPTEYPDWISLGITVEILLGFYGALNCDITIWLTGVLVVNHCKFVRVGFCEFQSGYLLE